MTSVLKKQDKNKVLAQAWIDYNPDLVSIDEENLNKLLLKDVKETILDDEENQALKGKSPKEIVRYLLALNSINYQFWDIKNGEFVRYQNNNNVGALAMNEGFKGLFKFMSNHKFNTLYLKEETVEQYFGDIPEVYERVSILKEAFNKNIFDIAWNVIEEEAHKGLFNVDTASKLADIMPISYADPYLKKIQLSLFEIAEALNKHGFKISTDLTVAADYQIPKVLESKGVLVYNKELSKKIENQELIMAESKEEKALRSATIIACNEISEKHNISIPALDRMLWLARNDTNKKFHLTQTPRY